MHEPEVSQQLLAVYRHHFFRGFKFDQKLVFDKKIIAEGIFDNQSIEPDLDRPLPVNLQTTSLNVFSQNPFINRLQQTGAQLLMNAEPTVNRDGRQIFKLLPQSPTSSRLCVFACQNFSHVACSIKLAV